MRASQTMHSSVMLLVGLSLGTFFWGMDPQVVPVLTGTTISDSGEPGISSAVTLDSADRRPESDVSLPARNEQALFIARLLHDNKEQKNVCRIDFSDAVYAKRALQYKFYTRDVQDLLSKDGNPAGPAAHLILSILVPLYQGEYAQEKKENEVFQAYLLRSSQERFGELECLVKEMRLFQKLDTLYVPLCDAILADQVANEDERHGEC